MRALHRLWPYAVLLCALVPFLGKPFHIDDPVFITIADHIRGDPTHPYDVRINWTGRERPASEFMGSPPLYCYYLAVVRATGPDSEWWAHLWMLPLSLLGLYAVRRMGGEGNPLAGALYLSSPAVLVSATTLMPDIPVAALTALGAAFFLERRYAVAASILLVAGLTRYNTVAVLPALAFYGLVHREWRGLLALALPVCGIASWIAASPDSVETGKTLLSLGRLLADRLVATPVFLAAASISPLSLVGIQLERLERYTGLAVAAIAGVACATLDVGRDGVPRIWLGVLGAIGVFALVAHLLRAVRVWRRDGEPLDLALWLWVVAALAIPLLYIHVAAKYLSMAAAPLALLATRASALRSAVAWVGIGAWFILACCLNVSDDQLARTYRSIAESKSSPNTWIAAHWGVQWYGAQQGAMPIGSDHTPEVGDTLLLLDQAGLFANPRVAEIRRVERLESIEISSRWPIRMLNTEAHAGWYSQHWGLLPYAFSTKPIERMTLLRIVALRSGRPPRRAPPPRSDN